MAISTVVRLEDKSRMSLLQEAVVMLKSRENDNIGIAERLVHLARKTLSADPEERFMFNAMLAGMIRLDAAKHFSAGGDEFRTKEQFEIVSQIIDRLHFDRSFYDMVLIKDVHKESLQEQLTNERELINTFLPESERRPKDKIFLLMRDLFWRDRRAVRKREEVLQDIEEFRKENNLDLITAEKSSRLAEKIESFHFGLKLSTAVWLSGSCHAKAAICYAYVGNAEKADEEADKAKVIMYRLSLRGPFHDLVRGDQAEKPTKERTSGLTHRNA